MVEELKEILNNVKEGKMDDKIISFTDYKSKYVHLKPRVTLTAEFTDGKAVVVDITEYFKEVVK